VSRGAAEQRAVVRCGSDRTAGQFHRRTSHSAASCHRKHALLGVTGHAEPGSQRSLWPPCVADAVIIFLSCFFFFRLSSLFFSSPNLSCRRLDVPYFHTWCVFSANLECKSEMYCTRLAENTGRKKSPSRHHHTTSLGHIFATKARIDNRKKLVKQ